MAARGRAQQPAVPLVGFINAATADAASPNRDAFRRG